MTRKYSLPFFVVCVFLAASSIAQTAPASTKTVKFLGTTHIKSGSVAHRPAGSLSNTFVRQGMEVDAGFDIPGANGNNSPARVKAAHVPSVVGSNVSGGAASGFVGLTEFDQAFLVFAGSPNGVNGELEPPDQGLAVGNGFVVEAINNAIAIFDTSGNPLAAEALNPFFEQPPEATFDPATNLVGPPFGSFISDPRVLYDASTGRFFISVVEIDVDPASGALSNKSHFMFAVSVDSNPFDGFSVFSLDTTNDGDARFGSCPCFGDQPLVGFDANGYYLGTNAFSLSTRTFRGAQLYAMSKAALEATPPSGTPIPVAAVHFGNLN